MATMTGTYSPEDNKLRLRASERLDRETYDRVKAAGFIWAPKQELFVAPAWTPEREDLLLELCGEIGDEDTSLVDRAEERAERFEEYSEKRAADAEGARKAVAAIADSIPLGQPILVGHHSEKRARKDADRIRSGMNKAVKMWQTSKYWEARAKGALLHAKYLERPDVRHRRIKGLEADLRKQMKETERAAGFAKAWQHLLEVLGERDAAKNLEHAKAIANYDHCYIKTGAQYEGDSGSSLWSALEDGKVTPEAAAKHAIAVHERNNAYRARWVAHLNNRLTYERAMLNEQGGSPADKWGFVVGGKVLLRTRGADVWHTILRVNRASGKVNSLRTTREFVPVVGVEEVLDYRAPEGEDAAKVRAATKLPPLCNYRVPGCLELTKAEWDRRVKCQYASTRVAEANEQHGRHRYRSSLKGGGNFALVHVFIVDAKEVPPPAPARTAKPELPEPEVERVHVRSARPEPKTDDAAFRAMKEQLRGGGVQVVSAPQLFPTPRAVVERMIALADIQGGQRVLEPSAGTGAILEQIAKCAETEIVAVEIRDTLADHLRRSFPSVSVHHADFTAWLGEGFDRVIMNPPFRNGEDIEHILHARQKLKPGGKLVAICAGGPRQEAKLQPLADSWEELPSGTFEGTNVRAVLLTMSAQGDAKPAAVAQTEGDFFSVG